MTEITKVCTVAFIKARNSLVVQYREKHANSEKKKKKKKMAEDGKNLFFKALVKRFWLTLKSYSWFNKVTHGRPSIKQTS